MPKIVQKEDPVLRKVAEKVPLSLIVSPRIRRLIKDMSTALQKEADGVAIAACQIGVPLSIFVVSERALSMRKGSKPDGEKAERQMVCINPEIIKQSKEKQWLDEGCLSARWLYGKMERFSKVTVSAYDEKGKRFTRGASGLLAQIFQHEIDHLHGKLFLEKAKNIQEILPARPRGAGGSGIPQKTEKTSSPSRG